MEVTDTDLRALVGYNMKRAFNAVQADLLRTLGPFELRMVTYSALSMINENPGLRPSQLAEGLSVERANLVIILGELTERGLVHRAPSPSDRRAQVLTVTPIGRSLLENARSAVARHDERLVKALPTDQVEALRAALSHIEATAKGGRE